jgi:hypothetical protein
MSYIIMRNPGPGTSEVTNPTFLIDLTRANAQDLIRYVTKLNYEDDIRVDYDKVIKQATDIYIKKVMGGKERKEFAEIKEREIEQINKKEEKEKPKFPWDKSNKKKGK